MRTGEDRSCYENQWHSQKFEMGVRLDPRLKGGLGVSPPELVFLELIMRFGVFYWYYIIVSIVTLEVRRVTTEHLLSSLLHLGDFLCYLTLFFQK